MYVHFQPWKHSNSFMVQHSSTRIGHVETLTHSHISAFPVQFALERRSRRPPFSLQSPSLLWYHPQGHDTHWPSDVGTAFSQCHFVYLRFLLDLQVVPPTYKRYKITNPKRWYPFGILPQIWKRWGPHHIWVWSMCDGIKYIGPRLHHSPRGLLDHSDIYQTCVRLFIEGTRATKKTRWKKAKTFVTWARPAFPGVSWRVRGAAEEIRQARCRGTMTNSRQWRHSATKLSFANKKVVRNRSKYEKETTLAINAMVCQFSASCSMISIPECHRSVPVYGVWGGNNLPFVKQGSITTE